MPLFPSLNDLKGLTISINPLNFFDGKPVTTDTSSTTVSSPTTPRAGEPGPGPSSLSMSTRLNGSSPLANGAKPARPPFQTSSSESGASLDCEARPSGARRASGQVVFQDESKRREKKKKVPMDSYIIVKPPPTSSKNPLNLQIQLVFKAPPGRRDRGDSTATRSPSMISTTSGLSLPVTPTREIDGLPTLKSTIMARNKSDSPTRMSDRDDASVHSATASAANVPLRRTGSRKSSTSTAASAASTTSGMRRIQPMFNLAVHNVMQPTLVTDAGTDAKVAKFMKRHIDIVGVGVLEPAEVWLSQSNASLVPACDAAPSRPLSTYSLMSGPPISPTVTRDDDRVRSSLDAKLRTDIISDTGAKKFFGKFGQTFKRKDKEKLSVPDAAPNPSVGIPASPKLGASGDNGHAFGPPTFGCAPTVIARRHSNPTISPDGAITGIVEPNNASLASVGMSISLQPSIRPIGYTWTVKRWAKSNTEGWAAHLVAAAAQGLEMINSLNGDGDDEVVFEWVKMRGDIPRQRRGSDGKSPTPTSGKRDRGISMLSPNLGQNGRASAPSSEMGDSPPERAPLSLFPPRSCSRPNSVRRASGPGSINDRVPTPTPSINGVNGGAPDDASQTYHTADEDSDPEDSETPWVCSLWVKRTNQRQMLATLTPAPHHPKVVGQLKIPMKLESVTLADLRGQGEKKIEPMTKGIIGAEEMRKKVEKEVCLGEEGLKDVVCVTAMWLVAREGWGGLGKRRKARA